MTIELARRGRAATVCAFSPVGFWSAGFQPRVFNKVQRGIALARRVRSILPFMYKSATVRQLILRDVAWHGDRVECGHLTWPHFGWCSSRILAPAGW